MLVGGALSIAWPLKVVAVRVVPTGEHVPTGERVPVAALAP
jgi:hypothetical protein